MPTPSRFVILKKRELRLRRACSEAAEGSAMKDLLFANMPRFAVEA